MASQWGRVQLEQSDMRPALEMAKMANEGFSRAAIEEMRPLIRKPCAEVRQETKQGVQYLGHNEVESLIETHPAMFRDNQTDGCVHCHNGTA